MSITHNQPKTIFISGATSGIGRATALLCRERFPDAALILLGRRVERLETLKSELGDKVHLISQDITDQAGLEKAIHDIPADFKNIDVLLNNAGLAVGADPFDKSDMKDLDVMVDTNVKGLVHLARLILPGMIERKLGYILNIGSIAGTYQYPGGHVYCGSKAFVNHFSKALRADLKGKNVRITSIEPGAVETEFMIVRSKGDDQQAKKFYETHRKLTPNHIANTLCWLMALPQEMNINQIEIMPTDQSPNGFSYDKFEG